MFPAEHLPGRPDPRLQGCSTWRAMPPVDWSKALQHLPEMDIIKAVDGPHGIFADRESPTGGAMIKRTPNDPAWYRGGLWHDDMTINVPGFWLMSWYDVSIGPTWPRITTSARRPARDRQRTVCGNCAHAALRLQARHRTHRGGRARAWAMHAWITTHSLTAGSTIF